MKPACISTLRSWPTCGAIRFPAPGQILAEDRRAASSCATCPRRHALQRGMASERSPGNQRISRRLPVPASSGIARRDICPSLARGRSGRPAARRVHDRPDDGWHPVSRFASAEREWRPPGELRRGSCEPICSSMRVVRPVLSGMSRNPNPRCPALFSCVAGQNVNRPRQTGSRPGNPGRPIGIAHPLCTSFR